MLRPACAIALASVLNWAFPAAAGCADDSDLTDLDRRVMGELSAIRSAGQVVLHYRTGDLTAEQLDAAAVANERAFRDLERLLEMKYAGEIHIFLYRDGDDLKKQTG